MATNYVKFEEKEIDQFMAVLDCEDRQVISLGDIESACRQLGLEESFENIRRIIKELVTLNKGEISVAELKKALLRKPQNQTEEMTELFNILDYDQKGNITKTKLKIMIKELTDETISEQEADEMIALAANEKGVIDLEGFLNLLHMKIEI